MDLTTEALIWQVVGAIIFAFADTRRYYGLAILIFASIVKISLEG